MMHIQHKFLAAFLGAVLVVPVSAQDPHWFLSGVDSLWGANVVGVETLREGKIPPPHSHRSDCQTVVAVIDGGFDISHPDLSDHIWENSREKAGNDCDDDRNGYVDDLHGWNFLGNAAGDDFQKAGTAAFREYKRLRSRYRSVDTLSLRPAEKAEYAYYKQMEHAARLDTYLIFAEFLRVRAAAFHVCDSLMTAQYGSRATTIRDFHHIDVPDTTGLSLPIQIVASAPVMFKPEMAWREAADNAASEYALAAKRVASLDSNEDDPHRKIGNDPVDFRNFHYGNSHIDVDPYHGTMVCGVIAACAKAAGDAAKFIKIQCIRAVPDGDEYDRDIAASIRYAVDNGACIINMSFGKYLSPYRKEVLEALEYARRKDVLLVMASGNDGKDVDSLPIYPTCRNRRGQRLDNMLVVGASSPQGAISSFSNYGVENVDMLAPGEQIGSTAPDGTYDTAQGTSIAAPVVAGIAAVIRQTYPDLSARQIRHILISTVTDISANPMLLPGSGKNRQQIMGSRVCASGGIVNAQAAMQAAARISKYAK